MARRIEFPDTYEKLLAMLHREHPTWTRAQVERYIAEQQRREDSARRAAIEEV